MIADSFVNYINLRLSFPTLKKYRDGDPWRGSFHLDENKLVGELAFLNPPLPPQNSKGSKKDATWLLPQKLDERKRVYIDQQIPLVSLLNIYREQEARVKPLSSWLCVVLQTTLRLY